MNLAAEIQRLYEEWRRRDTWRGTVTGTSGNLVTVRRTGQSAADPQSYARLASYTSPTIGDEVVVVRVGEGEFVVGKVLRS